jgi:hypothetical protein
MYELCSTGGRFHIRKTTRGRGGVRAEESPHLVRQKTAQLWEQLQRGRAR